MLGDELYENLCNDIELLDMAGDEFDMEKVNTGELTPMFFGSAMTNFGVQSFLEKFLEMSPMPQQECCKMVQYCHRRTKNSLLLFLKSRLI